MKILIGLYILTILFTIAMAIGLFVYWKFFKKEFTRERFAFLALDGFLTLAFAIIPQIFSESIISRVINLINELLGLNIPDYSSSITEKLLGIAIMIIYIVFIKYLFKEWSGEISLKQHQKEKIGEELGLIDGFLLVIKKNSDLEKYIPEKHDIVDIKFQDDSGEKLNWNDQVIDLLMLKSKQYKIDKEKDWYSEYNFYISEYGQFHEKNVIYCSLKYPNDEEIKNIIENIKNICSKDTIKNIIIAVNSKEEIDKIINKFNYTIRVVTEASLLKNLIDFSSYYKKIIDDFEKNQIIKGYELAIKDIFVKPICKKINRNNLELEKESILDIKEYITEWLLNFKDRKQLALLGEYGQGKSVFAQWISYLIIKKELKSDKIPIIIELRGKYPKQYSSKTSLLSDWSSTYGIDSKALYKLYSAGKLLLIFDGFDEMELVGDESIRLEHFKKIWLFATENSKMIITGRPNFFLNNHELDSLLRLHKTMDSLPYCEELHIDKFDTNQIKEALRSVEEETKIDILNLVKNKNKSFYDLVSRPALLFLTSIVWKEGRLDKNKVNSYQVIKEFITMSYSRQNKKGDYTPLGIFEREFFMQGIAIGMCNENQYTNQISGIKLKEIITKLYDSFPNDITEYNKKMSEISMKKLSERFDSIYNKDTIIRDIISCGILVRDLSTFDSFKFAHKSFLEYYVSNFYVTLLTKDRIVKDKKELLTINSIKNILGINRKDVIKNPEVLKFSSEMLASSVEQNNNDDDIFQMVYKLLIPNKLIRKLNYQTILKRLNAIVIIEKHSFKINTIAVTILMILLLLMEFENPIQKKVFKDMENLTKLGTLFIGFCSLTLSFAQLKFKRRYRKNLFKDDLILWYITCLELGISKQELEKKIPRNVKSYIDKPLEYILFKK